LLALSLGFAASAHAEKDVDQFAKLFAGNPLPPGHTLPPAALETFTYTSFLRDLDEAWTRYDKRNLKPVAGWVDQELNVAPDLVFYPFSGPDILNALAFFPHGKRYLLVGLERIGEIPDEERMTLPRIILGIHGIRTALGEILGLNFFRTQDMRSEVGAHAYSGTAAIILLFLSRTGHVVTDARTVEIDAEGKIVPARPGQQHATGLEVHFRGPEDVEDRIVYYFRRDLSNPAWERGTPGIERLLMHEPKVTTFLKAASYLMFKKRFSRIRELILDRSDRVVQDASGIPFKYFQKGPWSCRLYGQYKHVINLFRPFEQPRLRAAFDGSSRGRLPFSFGYDFQRGASHLIVASPKSSVHADTR
jgi:hypothetical protein